MESPQEQYGILTYKGKQIRILRMGQGKKILLAFHGFGEDATVFEMLAKAVEKKYTVIAFDFPGQSAALWKGSNKPNCKIMSFLIRKICDSFQVEQVTLLGFSMGGRMAQCIAGYMPKMIEKLILLAPDGLSKNNWYYLSTRTLYGSLLFKHILRKPEKWLGFMNTLTRVGLLRKSWQKLAQKTLQNQGARERVLTDWSFTKNFIPNPSYVQKQIRKYKIPLHLFMGETDAVFPPEDGRFFIRSLPTAQLHILPCGHHILKPENLSEIIAAL